MVPACSWPTVTTAASNGSTLRATTDCSAVTVFARAVDYADNVTESDQLTISITP
jgi:hypothetical protein